MFLYHLVNINLSFVHVFMVFNATFNNISVTSWQSVLLVEEYLVKTTNLSQVTDKLYLSFGYKTLSNMKYGTHTSQSFNQNAIHIGCSVLIGRF